MPMCEEALPARALRGCPLLAPAPSLALSCLPFTGHIHRGCSPLTSNRVRSSGLARKSCPCTETEEPCAGWGVARRHRTGKCERTPKVGPVAQHKSVLIKLVQLKFPEISLEIFIHGSVFLRKQKQMQRAILKKGILLNFSRDLGLRNMEKS